MSREQTTGQLRERLNIQMKSETQDSFGAIVEHWVHAFYLWGACQRLGSREFPLDRRLQSETTARFIIRYMEGIDAKNYRIVHAGKTWNLAEPIPDERHRFLTIEASVIE